MRCVRLGYQCLKGSVVHADCGSKQHASDAPQLNPDSITANSAHLAGASLGTAHSGVSFHVCSCAGEAAALLNQYLDKCPNPCCVVLTAVTTMVIMLHLRLVPVVVMLAGGFSAADMHSWLVGVLPGLPTYLPATSGSSSSSTYQLFKHHETGTMLGCIYGQGQATILW